MKPIVSVLIVTHNRPDTLVRAIKSLENQTFKNFETIIVNNGIIIPNLSAHKIQIKYISTYDSAIASIDLAYNSCSGSRIIRLDDDDELYPNSIENLCGTNAQIVYGDYDEIYNNHTSTVRPANLMESIACGVMLNKKAIDSIGGLVSYDVGMFIEYDLYIRAFKNNLTIN